MNVYSISACTSSPLKGLIRNLASALHALFQAQFAAFWTSSNDQRQILQGGNQFTLLHPVSWQTGKKAAGYSSSPYLLFRTQHKSPGKSEPIVLVTNKETSSTIIYIKFGRIKSVISLRMQCYPEIGSVVLSHFFHVQLASGVLSSPLCCFLQLQSY